MRKRRNPIPRVFLIAVAVAAGLLLLYLIAANVLLSGRMLRAKLDKGPEGTFIGWTSARSLWPGRVEVRGLRIRDRDDKAEWMFELEHARLRYSLLGLLRKRLDVRHVRGRGLTFHARNRLEKSEATPERVRHLPPIFGLPDPPLKTPADPPSTRRAGTGPERTKKGLDVQVTDLVVEGVREIWVDTARFEGDARLTGGFFLRPKVEAEVFRSSLELRSGKFSVRGTTAFDRVSGALGGVVKRWDPRRFSGSRMLRFLDGEASIAASSKEIAALDRLLGGFGQLRLVRGHPTVRLEMSAKGGLCSGAATIEAPELAARVVDYELTGRLSGRIRFQKYDLREGSGQVSGSHFELRGVAMDDEGRKGEPWWGRAELAAGTFRLQPAAAVRGSARIRARDARPLLAIFKVNLPRWVVGLFDLEGVAGTASVHLAPSRLDITRLDARVGDYHLQGDYRSQGRTKRGVVLIDLGALSVGIGIRDGEGEVEIIGARKWFRDRAGREPVTRD
ncbi:MAG: hypothetical protein H7X85_01380 [Thermoanaerobaculia bacterium]|nr:hypothetical protein [Thermoanaerobaculia bacterium]